MYEIAAAVADNRRTGGSAVVAWPVEVAGFSSRERNEALAVVDGAPVGSVLSGSLDAPLIAEIARGGGARLVDLVVGEVDAAAAGLACGGRARCLVVPAEHLPDTLWPLLLGRRPVCLVSTLDGIEVVRTDVLTADDLRTDDLAAAAGGVAALFRRGQSTALVEDARIVTVLWPVPRMLVVGGGAIADALHAAGAALGWDVTVTDDPAAAVAHAAALSMLDKLVVLSHDDEVAGAVLAAALGTEVGYIGALGSRRTQRSRADWLAAHGIIDLARIYGPAGLDIGSRTAAEIAVAVVAEALRVASDRSGRSLRDRDGAIHG